MGVARGVDGADLELCPRPVTKGEAWRVMEDDVKRPPAFLHITEYLRMDLVVN